MISGQNLIKAETFASEVNYIVANKKYLKESDSSKKLSYFICSIFIKKLIEDKVEGLDKLKTTYSGGVIRIYFDEIIKSAFRKFTLRQASAEEVESVCNNFKEMRPWYPINENHFDSLYSIFSLGEAFLDIVEKILSTTEYSDNLKKFLLSFFNFFSIPVSEYDFKEKFYITKKNIYYQIKLSNVVSSEQQQKDMVSDFLKLNKESISLYEKLTDEEKRDIDAIFAEFSFFFKIASTSNVAVLNLLFDSYSFSEVKRLINIFLYSGGSSSYSLLHNSFIARYLIFNATEENIKEIKKNYLNFYNASLVQLEEKDELIKIEEIEPIAFTDFIFNSDIKSEDLNFIDVLKKTISTKNFSEELEPPEPHITDPDVSLEGEPVILRPVRDPFVAEPSTTRPILTVSSSSTSIPPEVIFIPRAR